MTKVIYCCDYDHCTAVKTDVAVSEMSKKNQDLIDEMVKDAKAGKAVTVTVGSNRQDGAIDQQNSDKNKTHSCYAVLKDLAQTAQSQIGQDRGSISFSGILTADISQNREMGVSLAKYEDIYKDPNPKFQAEALADESKISTLYAQMHYFAAQNPNEAIEFKFFDDNKEILNGINDFFGANPDLIPKGVTLTLVNRLSQEAMEKKLHKIADLGELLEKVESFEDAKGELASLFKEDKSQEAHFNPLNLRQIKDPEDPISKDDLKAILEYEISNFQKEAKTIPTRTIQGTGTTDNFSADTVRAMWLLAGRKTHQTINGDDEMQVTSGYELHTAYRTNWMVDPYQSMLAHSTYAAAGYKEMANEIKAFRDQKQEIFKDFHDYYQNRSANANKYAAGSFLFNLADKAGATFTEKHRREFKLSAAEKICNYIIPKDDKAFSFSPQEIAALKDGKLNKLVQKHLDKFPQEFADQFKPVSTSRFKRVCSGLRSSAETAEKTQSNDNAGEEKKTTPSPNH